MKIIVTGCTGLIGAEVLQQALKHSSITSVVALTRRPLPADVSANAKLKTVILNDFTEYSESALQEMAGATGCAWALGQGLPRGEFAAYHKTNVETQRSALKVIVDRLAPQLPAGQKFRFSYCSGKYAERDATKKLWFLQEARRIQGEGETVVLQAAEDHPNVLETYVLRPGGVLAKTSNLMHAIMGSNSTIKVDDLAAALLESAMYGSATQYEESKEVSLRGRKFLDAQIQSK